MTNSAKCPKCGQQVPVRKDGKIARHPLYLGAPVKCSGSALIKQ